MKCISTRAANNDPVSIDAALIAGLAHDGGLYVPLELPELDVATIKGDSLAQVAHAVLTPFFEDSLLHNKLAAICDYAFEVPTPLRPLSNGGWLLELFHGPTAAFKDYAARFLAEALSQLQVAQQQTDPITTIITATSGDTGAAIASAFYQRPGFRVVILYPDGRVSPRQAHTLSCWGENIHTYRVQGSFDDCQRLAKQALTDQHMRKRCALSSANSISLGRLLPQIAYYAWASLKHWQQHGRKLAFIVPTGNLGNATAAFMAKRMGLPVGDITLATNSNDVLARYFNGEPYKPKPAHTTLANAMDVSEPSNFERLRYWYANDAELRAAINAYSVDDTTIKHTIQHAPERHGIVPCPHTATGLKAWELMQEAGIQQDCAIVATAHPAKFADVAKPPLIPQPVQTPPQVAKLLAKPAHSEAIPADYSILRAKLVG